MGFRSRLWEIRGDWKWHFQCFGLQSNWMADSVCHCCAASKCNPPLFTDFSATPAWLPTVRSHQEFLLQQLPQTRAFNSLVYSIGFDYRMVQWCGMHVVHLGIGLHANGGGMHELLQHHHFQGATEHARFASAFASFKLWCRTNGVECSQSAFKPWMLVTKGEEFCYLQTKAAILSGVSGYVFFHSPQIKSEPHYK